MKIEVTIDDTLTDRLKVIQQELKRSELKWRRCWEDYYAEVIYNTSGRGRYKKFSSCPMIWNNEWDRYDESMKLHR